MSNSVYTQDQFRNATTFVKYEVVMLFRSLHLHHLAKDQLSTAIGDDSRGYFRTAQSCALESFLVHYRNLREFLNNLSREDDVKAEDYASSWVGGVKMNDTFTGEKQRIDKLLAHISFSRLQRDPGGWDLGAMEANVRTVLKAFLLSVDIQHSPLFDQIRGMVQQREAFMQTSPTPSCDGNSTATVVKYDLWWE